MTEPAQPEWGRSADYSQVELRMLAHLSGDQGLRTAFKRDEDIHATVAAEVLGVPLAEVDDEMRSTAKMINFGSVYGITAVEIVIIEKGCN